MSLHFSDEDDLYENNANKEKSESNNLNYDFFTDEKNDNSENNEKNYNDENNEKNYNDENNEKKYNDENNEKNYNDENNEKKYNDENNEKNYNDENYMQGEEYDEMKEDNLEGKKKKKKKSVVFQLKNLFNEVALNKINSYIEKKRKNEHRNSYDDDSNLYKDENEGSTDEDELQKYVREEKNKIKQILPEKDELWEIYLYLNLKKKKRKIDYDEKYYSSLIKKILENVEKEYKDIIKEKLFQNKNFEEYLIITDFVDFLKSNNIQNIERNILIPLIKKKNSLIEIKKKLVELYNKGNCCSYIKDINFLNEKKEQNLNEQVDSNDNIRNYENYNKKQNTNLIIEKEKLNLYLSKLYDKYAMMINKIKKHKRKDLRTNFNLFMNLINEVTSKLYFSIHNVFLMDDNNSNINDIYKTIRRKYNIHDVLSKIQKLTQKKEVYEHYRSYLIYKYKTTYPVCDNIFKNHIMKDNINIFNFKKFYNTEFLKEKFFIIREDEDTEIHNTNISDNEKNEKGEINNENKKKMNNNSPEDLFTNDIYNDDFFSVNMEKNNCKENLQDNNNNYLNIPEKKEEKNQNNNINEQKDVENNNNVEETPLEKAKRIAREKKKKLLESRIKII
ncbi:conserved Plasmodium protein, unknown function [Plasmodium gallinaceum]|uniref:Uncharacterized protein n=1 Tax=Plasmodium gallinaceum TaxID=5849 RepID=A0A1J1GXD9_PLAGA|nr:conserved Plasmodium protein, unknown function [Plasmodium gallinaceum]CRG97225.1 conserved Plasmodium protein, unknown function [Plasmodium gallinaceum]